MFRKGESVRIARDLYEDGSQSFVGRVGRVVAADETSVIVNGLGDLDQPHDDKGWGFDPREVERA